jgi:hypothetical protein
MSDENNIVRLRPASGTRPLVTWEQAEAAVNVLVGIIGSTTASDADKIAAASLLLDIAMSDDNDSHRPPAA